MSPVFSSSCNIESPIHTALSEVHRHTTPYQVKLSGITSDSMTEHDPYALPRYEAVGLADIWPLVLPYLLVPDLLSLCRTSLQLWGRVAGYIWNEPRHYLPEDSHDCLSEDAMSC